MTDGRKTVADGGTYALPDGQLVRAFIERSYGSHEFAEIVQLFRPEEWALDDLHHYQADTAGRLRRTQTASMHGAAGDGRLDWTLADLRPADPAAWDAAVKRLGGRPWLPVDQLPRGDELLGDAETPPAPRELLIE